MVVILWVQSDQLRMKKHSTGKILTEKTPSCCTHKRKCRLSTSFSFVPVNQIKTRSDFARLCHGHRTYVFLWESEAENGLTRSLCLTLLRGHKGLCGGLLLLLYPCGRGAVTHRGLSPHPCKHFYKHTGPSCETHADAHKPKLKLVTRGWAGLCEEMWRSEKS